MSNAREILPGVYQVSVLGAAVTVLIESKQVVLLDAGLRTSPQRVGEFLAARDLTFSHVSHILVSHAHPDHVGGLARLQHATGAQVGAHPLEAHYVDGSSDFPNPASSHLLKNLLAPFTLLLRPQPVTVDLLLEDGARLDFLGGMQAVHTPGHTPGSLSFYLPSLRLLFVGDALQRRGGRLGLPDPLFTQDMSQAKASLCRLAELDVETLCFSHFPPILKGAQQQLQAFVESLP